MMKKVLSLLFIFFALGAVVTAQETLETPQEKAQKYGITFPIAELGGCENFIACRTFCDDPLNQATCEAFASAKGLYKKDGLTEREEELLTKAKSELGCSDRTSCMAVCHLKENFDRCASFAKRHSINGGHVEDPAKQEIILKAKETLGCDSETSCRAICEQPGNQEKCDNFAKQVGLRGGKTHRGPGDCTTKETCEAYCKDPTHFSECAQYGQKRGEGNFVGPGGCNSRESCQAYCDKNPGSCHSSEEQNQKRDKIEQCFGAGKFWYDDKCNEKPMLGYFEKVKDPEIEKCFQSGKVWEGGECRDRGDVEWRYEQRKAEEYAEYCQREPKNCQPGGASGFTNNGERTGFEHFCEKNPERCRIDSQNLDSRKRECESEKGRQYGCRWTDNRCECSNYKPHATACPEPANGCPGGTSWDRGTCTCKPPCGSGYSWNGRECMKDSSPSYATGDTTSCPPPASGCGAEKTWDRGTCTCKPSCAAGTSWNGSYCMKDSSPESSGGTYTQPQQTSKTPEQMCAETPNCRWENNTCNCSSSSGSGTSPEGECRQSGKCWQDGQCRDCQPQSGGTTTSGESPSPEEMCKKTSGCAWQDNACRCGSEVHGAATELNFLQRIFGFLGRTFRF